MPCQCFNGGLVPPRCQADERLYIANAMRHHPAGSTTQPYIQPTAVAPNVYIFNKHGSRGAMRGHGGELWRGSQTDFGGIQEQAGTLMSTRRTSTKRWALFRFSFPLRYRSFFNEPRGAHGEMRLPICQDHGLSRVAEYVLMPNQLANARPENRSVRIGLPPHPPQHVHSRATVVASTLPPL